MTQQLNILLNLKQEMNRGTLVLAVLCQLDEPRYGYALIERCQEVGLDVDQNTLYPLLRRLEKQGLCESIWQVEANRPRHYYKISSLGIEVRRALIQDYKQLEGALHELIKTQSA